ncbi:MAG: ABC transporter permease [Rhodovarius sp.]|nr:ABC transporter permease [Rhodovarius sp.]MCX7932168.1 ABC transporter permease [Rhodovarius sp.]MDW8315785.1 ABC transporter permease [Rhodovarius sp.]
MSIAGRLLQILLTTALLSFVFFMLIGLMPGDPIDLAIAGDPRLSAEDAARLRALYGLDRPLVERYLAWAGGVLEGRFGYSRLFAQPVADLLWPALRSTLLLVGLALLIAAGAGVAFGVAAALKQGLAGPIGLIALLAQAVPGFWLGILLIMIFAVTLGWLPAGGMAEEGEAAWRFLVLPVATLAFAQLAAYTRHAAAAMADALRAPWIRTARARGASEARIAWQHAFPNAAVPVITLIGLDAGALVSGAVITEALFARPGMGKLIYDAVMGNDSNLALLALLVVAVVTMLGSLAADLAQRALDPRLR